MGWRVKLATDVALGTLVFVLLLAGTAWARQETAEPAGSALTIHLDGSVPGVTSVGVDLTQEANSFTPPFVWYNVPLNVEGDETVVPGDADITAVHVGVSGGLRRTYRLEPRIHMEAARALRLTLSSISPSSLRYDAATRVRPHRTALASFLRGITGRSDPRPFGPDVDAWISTYGVGVTKYAAATPLPPLHAWAAP